MRHERRAGIAALGLTALLLLAACTQEASSGSDGASVQVTLTDDAVALSPTSVGAGTVAFTSMNDGTKTHEFEVFSVPEGVDANALTVEDGVADTNAEGLEVIDEVEDIAPGTSAGLTLDLDRGTYAVLCNLSGHYERGMHATLTVG
jgi:iron uptake system component EfeO